MTNPAHILLVDDDVELAGLLRDYLVRDGFTAEAVPDGESGVAAALSGRFAIVVLDVMMAGIGGIEALRRHDRQPADQQRRLRGLLGALLAAAQEGAQARCQLAREGVGGDVVNSPPSALPALCASPNQIPVVMLKSFITVFISLVASIHSFGQFTFKGDSTDMRIQSGAMEEIDKKFSLRNDNEFELRFFIFPKWSDSKEGLSIFILSFKSGEWKARLFKNAWSPEQSQEFPLKSDGLDSLWKELDKNNVLTIPLAQT